MIPVTDMKKQMIQLKLLSIKNTHWDSKMTRINEVRMDIGFHGKNQKKLYMHNSTHITKKKVICSFHMNHGNEVRKIPK
jgi:hypothetical protein